MKRGELIFWNGPHADYGVLDEMRHAFARVGDLNPHALLAGIMAEAEEGLSAALGGPDARPASAIVIGQGMLGHLAGQWLRWRGASVVVVENSPKRLEFSKYLGLTQRIDTHNADWRDRIRRWLPAEGAEILVDACGYARPFLETLPFVREGGKALFLGEWRPELNPVQLPTDAASILHERGLQWSGPPPSFGRAPGHASIAANWLRRIGAGKLQVDRLITNHTPASGAAMDLKRLATGVKSICGVVIHWTE
ncbi:zinc-binding dehydrogenase [Candidatus Sumerlaeota bacterium]|nr:zinc-binding dehydrogenase [Candidatus Sumerlaeota bacterium]